MSYSFPDAMVIQASGFGPAMTARQAIQRARKVILDFETISPWRRPFAVSGSTKETNRMPIAEDLSDFDEVVMRALQSREDVRYYNENDPDNWRLTPDSYSPYGFGEIFSDAHAVKGYSGSISISLDSAGAERSVSHHNSVYSVRIPFYAHDQINAAWSKPNVVYSIFNYLIDNYNPLKCVVFSTEQALRISQAGRDYTLGWLNYSRNPTVAGVFTKTGKAVPYRAGVLLKLGDDVSILTDPKTEAELIEIGQLLSSAGVTR